MSHDIAGEDNKMKKISKRLDIDEISAVVFQLVKENHTFLGSTWKAMPFSLNTQILNNSSYADKNTLEENQPLLCIRSSRTKSLI